MALQVRAGGAGPPRPHAASPTTGTRAVSLSGTGRSSSSQWVSPLTLSRQPHRPLNTRDAENCEPDVPWARFVRGRKGSLPFLGADFLRCSHSMATPLCRGLGHPLYAGIEVTSCDDSAKPDVITHRSLCLLCVCLDPCLEFDSIARFHPEICHSGILQAWCCLWLTSCRESGSSTSHTAALVSQPQSAWASPWSSSSCCTSAGRPTLTGSTKPIRNKHLTVRLFTPPNPLS